MNDYKGFKSQALDFNVYSDGVSVSSVTKQYALAPVTADGKPLANIDEGGVKWSMAWLDSPPPYTDYPTGKDTGGNDVLITNKGKNAYWERQVTYYSNKPDIPFPGNPSKSTMLDVDFINALGITAKKITVLKDNEAASNPTTNPILFEADGYNQKGEVKIGGFVVDTDSIASGDRENNVGIILTSTDGTDGDTKVIQAGTNFSVNADGNMRATGGTIGGWEISKDSLAVSGSAYTYKPSGALETTTTYTNTLAAAPLTLTLPTPEITIDDFGASTKEYIYVGEGEKKEETVSYTIKTANWNFSNPGWYYDAASLPTKTWQLKVETPCTEADISLTLNETYSLGNPIHVELPKTNGEFNRQSFEDGCTLNYTFRDAPLADRQITGTCTVKFYGSTIETIITSLSLSNKSNPFEPPVDDPKLNVTIAITNCKNPTVYSCTKEITYKLQNPTIWQDLSSVYIPTFDNKTLSFDATGSRWLQLTSSSDSTLDISPKLSANYSIQNNLNYCIKLKVDLGNDIPCKIPYAFTAYPTIDVVTIKRDDLACILALGKTSANKTNTAPFRVDLDGTVHISRGGLELTGDGKAYSGGWGSNLREKTLYVTKANQAQFTTTKVDDPLVGTTDYWDNWAQQGTTQLFNLVTCAAADQPDTTTNKKYGDWRSSGFTCLASGKTTHNGSTSSRAAFIQGLATSAYHARDMHSQLVVGEWNDRRIDSNGVVTTGPNPILWGSFITPFTISDSPDLIPTYNPDSDDKKYHIENSKAASSSVGMCLVSGGTPMIGDDWPWAIWAGHGSTWASKAFRVGHDGTVITADNVHTSSDLNTKNTISDLSTTYDNFFDNLRGVSYKVNHGTSDRLHIGFIAQEVESALIQAGLTTQDFAGMCIEHLPDKDSYNLRYSEFIALNTDQIQKLKSRVAELEATVEELTKLINEKLNQA